MTRRSSRPVHLSWKAAPSGAVRPADLTLESLIPPAPDESVHGRLIHGDNLPVMASLLEELEGRIDLVYIDPPFLSGKRFTARVGPKEDSRRPKTWLTQKGYQDRWPERADYLDMLRPRLELIHRLLAKTGTFYVHLDWRMAGYVRVLLDELFGPDRLLNEIVWAYHGPSPIQTAFSRKHDTILAYTKSAAYTFNAGSVRVPYDPSTIKTFSSSKKAGFGKVPNLKRGKVPEDWWVFPVVARLHRERTGYPTQKPSALMERIVLASSNPGDLVADFFCGSGTTLIAAARHRRRWIGCDSALLACATSYRRLILECPGESVAWLADRRRKPNSLKNHLTVKAEGSEVTIRLIGPRLFQWFEVDWGFDGGTFRSLSRCARPWRAAGPLPPLRKLMGGSGAARIALRAADMAGRIFTADVRLRLPRRRAPQRGERRR